MKVTEVVDIATQLYGVYNPLYVYIIGGSASGKNYWYRNNLSKLPLVDIDVYVEQLVKTTGDNPRNLISKGIAMCNTALQQHFDNKTSVVQTGTGSNKPGVFNRLQKAKDAGFDTALILISADPRTAIQRNNNRVKNGGHGKTLPDIKIIKTNDRARHTYDDLSRLEVVTRAYTVQN